MGVDDIIINDYQGTDFESLCADILRGAKLWKTDRTGKTQDGGKDLVMTTDKGKTIYVECKAWSDRVTPKEIRAFHSVCVTDKVQGLFISVSGFTPKALEEAQIKGIKTFDVSDIRRMSKTIGKNPMLYSSSPVVMPNSVRNKVYTLKVDATKYNALGSKVFVEIDSVELPAFKSKETMFVILPSGKHRIHIRASSEKEDFDLNLKDDADINLKTALKKMSGVAIELSG